LLKSHFKTILPSTPRYSKCFPHAFTPKPCIYPSFPPYVLHSRPISSCLLSSPE
jgi:hypothetical protein